MLSKLRHAGAGVDGVDTEALIQELRSLFGGALSEVRHHPGGTLGVGFTASLSGRPRFFKTHALPSGRPTLWREAAFLAATAGERADARRIDTGSGARTWLHMALLRSGGDLAPAPVRELVLAHAAALKSEELAPLVPPEDGLALLLSRAETALAELAARQHLSEGLRSRVTACLDQLRRDMGGWPRQLCHGDLGPANLMADAHGLLAVDWEDAFWGVEGYDYLYWLTFFANRRWLGPTALGHTPWGRQGEVALMVMIVVLKSWLSVRDGSQSRHVLGIEPRLQEVLDLG